MIIKIVGVEVKRGTFTRQDSGEVIDYDNVFLYGLQNNEYSENNNFGFGSIAKTFKIKNTTASIVNVFGFELRREDLEAMVGKDYVVSCNEKGRVDSVFPYQKPAENKKGA